WDNFNVNDIKPLHDRFNKPIVFTELGYRSVVNGHKQPWNYDFQGPADQVDQANAYEALFSYWDTQSFMQGIELWHWQSNPNAGGANDTDFTPQNKQAETVMKKWWAAS